MAIREADNLAGMLRDLKRHTAKTLLRAMEGNQQESRREWMQWLFERVGHELRLRLNSRQSILTRW